MKGKTEDSPVFLSMFPLAVAIIVMNYSLPRRLAFMLSLLTVYSLLLTFLVACAPETPRLLTLTAQVEATATLTPAPVILKVETPTPLPGSQMEEIRGETFNTLTVWVNETSPAHAAALRTMAAEFADLYQIQVQFQMIMPERLPDLVASAVLSDTLPDLILHPIEYTVGWADNGVLDRAAAARLITQLDPTTYDAAALALIRSEAGYTALPAYGWKQIVLYRADRYGERNLAPPDSFANMLTAAAAFYDPPNLQSGLVVPTESNLVTTQQVFELFAAANGCDLIDEKGEIFLLEPACLDAMEFYRSLINQYSPSDVQTDISALNAYLNGHTSFIISSPAVLPVIGGLDPSRPPVCEECADLDYLARNSGVLTSVRGQGPLAQAGSLSELTYLGITPNADPDAAALFVTYWFNEGYLDWLAVNPEQKVPLRLGTPANPTEFIEAWYTFPLAPGGPTLRELYGDEVAAALAQDVANSTRWGFPQGQGWLVTRIYQTKLFSILLQEMLSGYFNPTVAINEGYKRVIALIPNYAYTIELEPTPTSTPIRR